MSMYNYTFDSTTRLGDDRCYVSERTKQNTNFGSYNIQNYYLDNCNTQNVINFATAQPNVFVDGGYKMSDPCGSNINLDSKMRIGSTQTNPRCRISLYTRPFVTVPYLGKGPIRVVEESRLQQNHLFKDKKSCGTTTEMSHIDHRFTPMVPSLQNTISNPSNLIEGVAAEGWIRGGLPTRELIRQQDYKYKK